MTIEITHEEVEGRAEQLQLPLREVIDYRTEELLQELDLVPAEQFAKALGIAEQTLAGWRSSGQGPDFAKLGKTVFYRRADIKIWIGKNITEANAA